MGREEAVAEAVDSEEAAEEKQMAAARADEDEAEAVLVQEGDIEDEGKVSEVVDSAVSVSMDKAADHAAVNGESQRAKGS